VSLTGSNGRKHFPAGVGAGVGTVGVGSVVSSSGFPTSGCSVNVNTSQISHAKKKKQEGDEQREQTIETRKNETEFKNEYNGGQINN
jgi:hypothetical protein